MINVLIRHNAELIKENEQLREKVVSYIIKWAIEKDKNEQLKRDIDNYIKSMEG